MSTSDCRAGHHLLELTLDATIASGDDPLLFHDFGLVLPNLGFELSWFVVDGLVPTPSLHDFGIVVPNLGLKLPNLIVDRLAPSLDGLPEYIQRLVEVNEGSPQPGLPETLSLRRAETDWPRLTLDLERRRVGTEGRYLPRPPSGVDRDRVRLLLK